MGEADGDRDASSGDGAIWDHSPDVAWVEHEDRVAVLDLSHLELPPYVFEGTAGQIWACLDGDRSEAELIADLAEAYEVPAESLAGDVRAFVGRLDDLGLVVRAARPALPT